MWSIGLGTWEVAGQGRVSVLTFVAFVFLCGLGLTALAARLMGRD